MSRTHILTQTLILSFSVALNPFRIEIGFVVFVCALNRNTFIFIELKSLNRYGKKRPTHTQNSVLTKSTHTNQKIWNRMKGKGFGVNTFNCLFET